MPKLLTEAQLRQFRDEGYALPFRAMSLEAALDCRRRIETYEAAVGHDANRTLKIKGHLAFPWLVELGCNPAVLDAVEDVIGPDILLFGASIFAKDARDPRYVSWHQDSAYFGLSPHREVTAWIGFTFWPGSSLCTPALAMISPSLTPEAISAVSSRQRAMVTGRNSTTPLALSTTQTAGWVPC